MGASQIRPHPDRMRLRLPSAASKGLRILHRNVVFLQRVANLARRQPNSRAAFAFTQPDCSIASIILSGLIADHYRPSNNARRPGMGRLVVWFARGRWREGLHLALWHRHELWALAPCLA